MFAVSIRIVDIVVNRLKLMGAIQQYDNIS